MQMVPVSNSRSVGFKIAEISKFELLTPVSMGFKSLMNVNLRFHASNVCVFT